MSVITDETPDSTGAKETDFDVDVMIESLNLRLKLHRAKLVINQLSLACEGALLLRGIAAAIRDPLALEGEKQMYRKRYLEIEAEIRAAQQKAAEFKKAQ